MLKTTRNHYATQSNRRAVKRCLKCVLSPPNATKLAISAGCWLRSRPGLRQIFAEWIQSLLASVFSHSDTGYTQTNIANKHPTHVHR